MRRSVLLLMCLLGMFAVGRVVIAQNTAEQQCAALISAAFEQFADVCGTMPGNSACYGGGMVQAAFNDAQAPFSTPGDTISLSDVAAVSASALDFDAVGWGLAALTVQANQPLTDGSAGVGLSYLLLGDVRVENRVSPEEAFLPVPGAAAAALIPVNVRVNPFEDSTVLTAIQPGQSFSVDAISADGAWLRAVAPDGVVGWVAAAVIDAEIDGLPTVTRSTFSPMQRFTVLTGDMHDACASAAPAPMLVIQSPETLTALIEANGQTIIISSTIALRVVELNGGLTLQLITLSGTARAGSVVIPEGFTASIQLNAEGTAAADGALWSGLRPITAEERALLTPLESLDAALFRHYTFALPTDEEIARILDAVRGSNTTFENTGGNRPAGQQDNLRGVSADEAIFQPTNVPGQPGATPVPTRDFLPLIIQPLPTAVLLPSDTPGPGFQPSPPPDGYGTP